MFAFRAAAAGLAFFVLVHSASSQTCDVPLLTASADVSTGKAPREVAAGDFDQTGFLDLAVQERDDKTVSILRGSGTSFTNLATISFPSVADILAADFNHDGWTDVVVSANENNEVAIALSDGSVGGFLLPDTFGVKEVPTALAMGDFDSDGHLDVAVYNSGAGSVSVLLGLGDGSFGVQPDFPMALAEEMAAADLDRDGDLDLVATGQSGNGLVVALGKNDGTFSSPVTYPGAGAGPRTLAVADFNRDGVLDVVTGNVGSSDIEFYRGDGAGGFSSSSQKGTSLSQIARISAGDIDGNGILDVVVSDEASSQIDVFLGPPSSWGGPFTEGATDRTFGIVAEDFNHDGRDDVAVAYLAADRVGLLTSQIGMPCPNSSFGRTGHYIASGNGSIAIEPGDFDRDGNLDFVAASFPLDRITEWFGRGIGRFQSPNVHGAPTPVSMDGGDFDADADRDLVIASQGTKELLVYSNTGGSFSAPTAYALPGTPVQVVAADVNFDGSVDLVASCATGEVAVRINDGTGGFPAMASYPVGASAGPVAVGDFDSDFYGDIAVGVSSDVVLLRNDGTGGFGSAGSLPFAAPVAALQSRDLNGDSHRDLVLALGSPVAGLVQTRLGNGSFGFAGGSSFATGGDPGSVHGLAVDDVNQDGSLDVLVTNLDLFRVHVLLGDGGGGFASNRVEPVPERPSALATGDYDRDGSPDLLVGLSTSDRVLYLPGRDGGFFSPAFFPAVKLDARSPAIGDVDRDGRLDVVIANFDDDSVSPYLGFGDGDFGPPGGPYSIAPGGRPRWVTLADFDDDGELDIVASAASGHLVFLGGGSGFPTTRTSPVVGNPYISRSADFDFDGNLDLAVLNGSSVEIYRGDGTGRFAPVGALSLGGIGSGLVVGDFDKDGFIDIAATQITDDAFLLFFGTGPGSWNPVALQRSPGRTPMDFDAADFDGNGFVDFAVPVKGTNSVRLILERGGTWLLDPTPLPAPREPVALKTSDINRDGTFDLVVASQGEHVVAFYLGDGTGKFGAESWATVGVRGPTSLAMGDFDADGANDVAVVPDSPNFTTPAGFASVLNTNCRSRMFDFLTDVSTCDLPGTPFLSQPKLQIEDDGENPIRCEPRQLSALGPPLFGTTVITPAPSTGVYSYSGIGVTSPGGGYQIRFDHAEARDKLSRTFSSALPVTINGLPLICQGDPAFYDDGPANDLYHWFVDSVPVSMAPAIDLTSFFGTNPGLHTLDLSVERDTCSASDFLDVDVVPNLLAVDVNPLGPISVCETCTGPIATVTTTGGGASTFQWGFRTVSGGSITPLAGETSSTYFVEGVDFPGAGTYFLVATASPTCGLASVSNEVTVDVTLSTPEPLVAITALSTNGQNFLEWAFPATPCTGLLVLRRDDGIFPTGPSDALAVQVSGSEFACAPNTKGSHPDTGLVNDTKYYYSAWVRNGPGNDSPVSNVKGRPFDHTLGKVKWALHTEMTAMTQPGIQIRAGTSAIYVPTNSGLLLALQGGSSGGMWLPGAMPVQLGLPSQSRPPVVPFPVGISPNDAPNGAAFVSSQDGSVYALDAEDLGPVWTANVGQSLQGAAAGIFTGFGATKNWILIGTRNTTPPNGLRAIHVEDGNLEWFFENLTAQDGDDSRVGMIFAGASVDYPGQRVFFGSWKDANGLHTLWALDISSTDAPFLLWAKDVGDVETNPVYLASQGKLVVGNKNGEVRLLNANDGTPLWTYTTGNGNVKGFVSPHLHGATTNFMFSTNSRVTSIRDNGGSASVNWHVTGIPSPSVPLFIPSTTSALVGSGNGSLYRIDGVHTATPTFLSNFVVLGDGSGAIGPAAFDVLNDMAIAGSEEGVIYGVEFPFP
jgi:hypothetical protein